MLMASKVLTKLELSQASRHACHTGRGRVYIRVEHTRVGDGVGEPLPLVQVDLGLDQGDNSILVSGNKQQVVEAVFQEVLWWIELELKLDIDLTSLRDDRSWRDDSNWC